MALVRWALVFALWPAILGAQQAPLPEPVWLEWDAVKFALTPDSSGTIIWVQSNADRNKKLEVFSAIFEPEVVVAWIDAARSFLRQAPRDGDTLSLRASRRMRLANGAGVYVAQRSQDGKWTPERFIVMERPRSDPLIVNGDDKSVGEILDSLEAVAMRTPIVAARPEPLSDSTAYDMGAVEKPASADPNNRAPAYPEEARDLNRDGTVILRFVIGVDGKPEMANLRVVFATNKYFLRSVMAALPRMKFYPAEVNGKKVRQQVQMPFTFSMIR
jgi:TonB family protein